jgi:hypothetical protein
MAEAVYMLCALTSIACAVLLLKTYARTHARLLFWSGLCFVCFAASNVVLFVDFVVFPDADLFFYRTFLAFAGLVMLLYGLVWESS